MTLGEAINAAATAGSRVQEAREKLRRAGSAHKAQYVRGAVRLAVFDLDVLRARNALAVAEIDHAAALGLQRQIEAAAGVGVGGGR